MESTQEQRTVRTARIGPQEIGKGNSPATGGSIVLTAYIPLMANITAIRAFIRNRPWGEGECHLGATNWVVAPLDGREPMGWCRAKGLGQGNTDQAQSQWVKVGFQSWSDCNSREALLEVDFEMYALTDESLPEGKPIDEALWKTPSML